MRTKFSERNRQMVLAGMFTAIIIVMTYVPYIGYISYTPLTLSITTIHLPVIIGAVMLGWKYGTILGGVWGVTCLIQAFLNPILPNVPFQNPLISVLPRIIVGFVAAALFYWLSSKKKLEPRVSAIISAVAATLTNTVLVTLLLHFTGNLMTSNGLTTTNMSELVQYLIEGNVFINGLVEIMLAVILTPVIYTAVSHYKNK